MNRRQELQALFERTQADDAVILRRMGSTARRRSPPAPFALGAIGWAMAAACLLGVAAWASLPSLGPAHGPEHDIAAEPLAAPAAPAIPPPQQSESASIERAPEPIPPLAPSARNSPASAPTPVQPRAGSHEDPARATQARGAPASAASERTPLERNPASWQAVAEALRNKNHEQATRLLDDLARSDDPEVRDGAELVRLQGALTEAGAHTASKRPTAAQVQRLEELARAGATSSIRASARKLLLEATRSSAASPP